MEYTIEQRLLACESALVTMLWGFEMAQKMALAANEQEMVELRKALEAGPSANEILLMLESLRGSVT